MLTIPLRCAARRRAEKQVGLPRWVGEGVKTPASDRGDPAEARSEAKVEPLLLLLWRASEEEEGVEGVEPAAALSTTTTAASSPLLPLLLLDSAPGGASQLL
jgi:hypothetical protein